MKILGYSFFEKASAGGAATVAKSYGRATGLFAPTATDRYKPKNLLDYFEAYTENDIVRAPIDDLVESAVGQGAYLTVDDEEKESSSLDICQGFYDHFKLDDLLPNIGKIMLIAGFCPVETRISPERIVENCALKVIYPLTVKEFNVAKSEPMQVVNVIQHDGTIIEGKFVAPFIYGRVGNDPTGMSYMRGVITALNLFNSATDSVDKLLKRYMSPIAIWKTMGSTDALKKMVQEHEAGEDFFIGNLNKEELESKDAIVQFLSVDPRVPFWDYIELLDRRIFSYFRSNNLYYSKDATVASAEVMDTIVQRHKAVIQKMIKSCVENYWFKPLVGEGGEVPEINFPMEKSGIQRVEVSSLINAGMQYVDSEGPYISRDQYYDMLKQVGFKVKKFKPDPGYKPPQPQLGFGGAPQTSQSPQGAGGGKKDDAQPKGGKPDAE